MLFFVKWMNCQQQIDLNDKTVGGDDNVDSNDDYG